MNELISIIVPIYRVENYLKQCLNSIINQTYKELEIILVDDGSDDNCPQICDEYARKDKRIKVIHQENRGQDSARKAAMAIATGKYIGYVDGDDWIEPDMFEELMRIMIDNEVSIIESGVIDSWINHEDRRYSNLPEGKYVGDDFDNIIAPYTIYSGSFFKHGIQPYLVTKLFNKACIEKYQLMEEPSRNIADDVMCVFPCILNTRSIYISHKCFYHYRVRENSSKRIIRKDIAEVINRCYKNWLSRFDLTYTNDQVIKQINYFIMYLLIAKAIYVFDDQHSNFYLTPYGSIDKNSKIVLYGAGTVGIHLHEYIKNNCHGKLVYWADKKYRDLDLDVNSPVGIKNQEYDYVIISILSENAVRNAKQDLLELGIPQNKIRWILQEYIDNPIMLLKKAKYGNEALAKWEI